MNRVITEQEISTAEAEDNGLNGSAADGLLPTEASGQDPATSADAPGGEGSADTQPESFYSGNPEDLPDELFGHYKDMERGFHRSMSRNADLRKQLQAELEAAKEERERLTHLGVQLQARLDAPANTSGQEPFMRDEARETGPSREDLIAQVKEKAQAGQGAEALYDLIEKVASRHAGQSEVAKSLQQKVESLESRLSQYEGPAKIQQQTAKLNAAFDELRTGEYPQLERDNVKSRVQAAFDGNDPVIQDLLANGMYKHALVFATERALREVTENRTIKQARRRQDTSPPRGESGGAEATKIDAGNMSFEDIVNAVLG